MRVVARRAGIRCPVALSARLDPDKGISQLVSSIGRRLSTEAGILDIAPVTPRALTGGLLPIAT